MSCERSPPGFEHNDWRGAKLRTVSAIGIPGRSRPIPTIGVGLSADRQLRGDAVKELKPAGCLLAEHVMTLTDMPTRASHLHEQIHEILWSMILKGEIEPGQRLKDTEWAERLGVSRTPVREAMRRMLQEGVLMPLSNGGYQARPVSKKDLQDLYSCRAALEVQAVREAAEHYGSKEAKQFQVMLRLGEDAINKGDLDKIFEHNTAFHQSLINLSQNIHLIGLWKTVGKLMIYYRSALLNYVKAEDRHQEDYLRSQWDVLKEHRAIVAALDEGDGEKAAELMRLHTPARESVGLWFRMKDQTK